MKSYRNFLYLLFLIYSQCCFAQSQNINSILDLTLSYRGLSREDITIPIDTSDKVNTNQCKLILPIVYNLMKDPLSSMPFLDTCMNYKNQPLEQLVYTMFKDINYYSVNMDQDYQFTTNLSELTDIIAKRIKIS